MKSTKLKKKVKQNQIIFPSTYLNPFKNGDIADKIQEKKVQKRLHRIYSKDKNQEIDKRSVYSRSLSLNMKQGQQNKKDDKGQNTISSNKKPFQRSRKLSTQKRWKRGSSATQLSKIYYLNLEKRLENECQFIMKQQNPKNKLQTYNFQYISNNLLRLNPKVKEQQQKSINIIVRQSQQSRKTSKEGKSQQSILSRVQTNDFLKDFNEHKQMTKKLVSNVEISISGKSIRVSQQQLLKDFRLHNSLMNDIGNTGINDKSLQSIFKSQVKYTLIQILEKTAVYFYSSKFSIKYSTIFRIISLKVISNEYQKTFQLEIFFKMYNQIIFKRVSLKPIQQKRSDYRIRKGNNKRMHLIRQKLKQKVLSNFTKEYSQELVMYFYQDLIVYLQKYIVFQKTYRGLVLIDHEQSSFQLKNHERIFEILKIHKSFYFILKLSYTFYIVKVILSPQMEIKFTFIYDFTTHSTGDQLSFTHPAPNKLKQNKNETQANKIFLKVIDEFVQNTASEWKCEYATNKQILQKESSAKILQTGAVSLEKWDGSQVNKLSNINKQLNLMGNLSNYFVFHDQFDYGFFNSPHYLLINGKYNYMLDEIDKNIPVYVYPHTYIYLQLTRIQKQMIVIPHVCQSKYPKHSQKFVNDFFHRQISKNYKKKHEFFKLFIDRKQIRMKQKLNKLEIYIHSPNNMRCDKLSIPITHFPSYNYDLFEQLNMIKASSHVQNFIKRYRIQKGFLYNKFTKQTSKIIIYHKGLEKLDKQFVFITLYGLPGHQIVQFKIFMFKFGRQFIIRFDSIDQLSEVNLKELIANLLQLIKNIYFKKLILEQARKSKKRRLQTLQVFLKKHGKSYVNQVRSKKKLDELIKRKIMKLANFKETNMNIQVYQNIITDYYQLSNGKQFFITIRFVPSEEFRQQNEWKNEGIEICMHKQGSISYFKFVISIKQLISSVSLGKLSLEHIDFRQVHILFKEINIKIKQIIRQSHRNFDFIICSLKHFLIYKYHAPLPQMYPYKFKLVQNIIYQTKNSVNRQDQVQSQISIQLQMQRQIVLASNNNLIFSPYLGSEQKQQISSNFAFICRKPVNYPYKRFIDKNHIIEIIDIFRENGDYKFLKECNLSTREIWITDRQTGVRYILSDWDIGFLGIIDFGRYNHRLFRRLLKSLRPAL